MEGSSRSARLPAGGTELILIDDANEDTQARLLTALQAIQVRYLSCDMPVPEPPPLKQLNYREVNVDFIHSSGEKEMFGYSDSTATECSGLNWRYDVPIPDSPTDPQPTSIELCKEASEAVQQDLDGELQVLLGCSTRPIML